MWQYGLKIPRDLSLVGFNDKFATEYMTPPLTTVGFDANRIGTLGAQMIIRSLTGAEESTDGADEATSHKSVLIKTQLIVRGSTAAPSSGQ
jgi:LacI family transcriptional regulator